MKDHITSRLQDRERNGVAPKHERVMYSGEKAHRRGVCYVCGSPDHYATKCPKKFSNADDSDDGDYHQGKKKQKSSNQVQFKA